jgi:hypothetical protein
MKISLKQIFTVAIIVAGLAVSAHAQQSSTPGAPPAGAPKNHPCASEHQAVVAACQKGDPCSAACKQAHQQMKACRVANNLPEHPHASNGAKKPKCPNNPAAPTTPGNPIPPPAP